VSKPTPDIEELEDYPERSSEPEPTADEQEPESWAGWNGRSSKIALAFAVNRDQQIVGAGDACIDCKKRTDPKTGKPRIDTTHQFHALASKDPATGRWTGPEGEHLETLRALGHLRNTDEARSRAEAELRIAALRGVERDDHCRQCGEPIPDRGPECKNGHKNGLESLRPLTTQQLRKQWHRVLKGGPAALLENERRQRREEVERLREAAGDIGREIAIAIKESLRDTR